MFVDTTTPLGISAVFTGTTRRVDPRTNRFIANAFADQAGTLVVQTSVDGTTWRQRASVAVSANAMSTVDIPITTPYARVAYTNGATAQTVFELTSALLTY